MSESSDEDDPSMVYRKNPLYMSKDDISKKILSNKTGKTINLDKFIKNKREFKKTNSSSYLNEVSQI